MTPARYAEISSSPDLRAALIQIGWTPPAEKKPQRTVKLPLRLKDNGFLMAWSAWAEYRRQAKIKAYTPMGAQLQLKKLAVMGPHRAVAAIEHSISQGFQGIYEERQPQKPSQFQPPQVATHDDKLAKQRAYQAGLDEKLKLA